MMTYCILHNYEQISSKCLTIITRTLTSFFKVLFPIYQRIGINIEHNGYCIINIPK